MVAVITGAVMATIGAGQAHALIRSSGVAIVISFGSLYLVWDKRK